MIKFFTKHSSLITVLWTGTIAAIAVLLAPHLNNGWFNLALLLAAIAPGVLALGLAIKGNKEEVTTNAKALIDKVVGWLVQAALLLGGICVLVYATDYVQKHYDRWFPRWSDGDCYVTILDNGAPITAVTRVITRAPNGSYLLEDSGGGPVANRRTMTEADYKSDETKFHLQFKKVKCAGTASLF